MHRYTLALCGLLLGCTQESTEWIYEEGEPSSEEEGEEGEEGEDEEGFDEEEFEDEIVDEKVIWGFEEGVEMYTGLYNADPEKGGVLCDVFFKASKAATDSGVDCAEAWEITRDFEWVEVDVDGACEAEGWIGLEGTSFGIGHDEESVLADLGDGWKAYENAEGELGVDGMMFEIQLD